MGAGCCAVSCKAGVWSGSSGLWRWLRHLQCQERASDKCALRKTAFFVGVSALRTLRRDACLPTPPAVLAQGKPVAALQTVRIGGDIVVQVGPGRRGFDASFPRRPPACCFPPMRPCRANWQAFAHTHHARCCPPIGKLANSASHCVARPALPTHTPPAGHPRQEWAARRRHDLPALPAHPRRAARPLQAKPGAGAAARPRRRCALLRRPRRPPPQKPACTC
jgi:hypothetical protein